MLFWTGHRGLIVRTSLHMLEIAGSSPGGDLDNFFFPSSDSVTLVIAI